jgi:hypothetical protein
MLTFNKQEWLGGLGFIAGFLQLPQENNHQVLGR